MTIIEASSVSVKTMADGTLRVTMDVEPRHAQAAFALFGSPGTPMALAALKTAAQAPAEAPVEPPKEPAKRMGPALDFLVKLSRDPEFLSWLESTFPEQWAGAFGKTPADKGASVVRAVCSVESRNEIDENRNAFALFEARIRKPWASRKSTKQPAQVAEEGETA